MSEEPQWELRRNDDQSNPKSQFQPLCCPFRHSSQRVHSLIYSSDLLISVFPWTDFRPEVGKLLAKDLIGDIFTFEGYTISALGKRSGQRQ